MKLLTWVIGVPVAVGAAVFAVVNRQVVTLDLWPLPWEASVPLFALVLGALGLGLFLGALLLWLATLPARGRARREGRRARKLEAEVQALRDEKAQVEGSATAAARKALPHR